MDKNEVIVAGTIGWHKLNMISNRPFGTLKLRLDLPKFNFSHRGTDHIVNNPTLWLGVTVSKDDNGTFSKRTKNLLDTIDLGTLPYAVITGAKVKHWKAINRESGASEIRFDIDCPVGGVHLTSKPVSPINKCTFEGKVVNYEPNGKMLLECSYLVPSTNEWKVRQVPIIYTSEFQATLTNKKVLLFGKACSVTPNGDSKTYIVSDEIYEL